MALPADAEAVASPRRQNRNQPWRLVALFAVLSCLLLFAWSSLARGEPTQAGLLLVPVLFALTAPLLVRLSGAETRFDIAGIMATGLALRFAGSYYRWGHAFDANVYQRIGAQLAESFRSFQFDVDTGAPVPGTGGLRYVTGLVSIPTGSNGYANFLVFTWLGFWGCVMLYRAFVTALPDADHRRYALLIFLWPSLAFWPSSIGKESWMLFTLGIAMLGAARVFVRRPGGYSLLTLGLLAGSFVRPHVGLLALIAFAIGLFIGRRESVGRGEISPALIGKVVGLAVVVLLGGVLVSRTQQLLDTTDTSSSSIGSSLDRVNTQTAQGGSEFSAANPSSPLGYPVAAVTILVRPFPFEAHGSEQLMTTAEGMFLAVLCVASWRRVWGVRKRLRDQPYYATAIVFALMFFYAFGTVANFGILARERVQLMPFVFVLLAAPAVLSKRSKEELPGPGRATRR